MTLSGVASSLSKHETSSAVNLEMVLEKESSGLNTKKFHTYHNCIFNKTQTSQTPVTPTPCQNLPKPQFHTNNTQIPTHQQYVSIIPPIKRNYLHVQPVHGPVVHTQNSNTDVWGVIPESDFANIDSIKEMHTGIRVAQKNPYHTSNTYAGAHHHPPPCQNYMDNNQNPTDYQNPQYYMIPIVIHPLQCVILPCFR